LLLFFVYNAASFTAIFIKALALRSTTMACSASKKIATLDIITNLVVSWTRKIITNNKTKPVFRLSYISEV